ncbi:hypothetical protein Tco_0058269 [Tanacetum coccineum]
MRFKIGGVTFSQIVNINEIDKGLLTIFHFCPVSTCMQYWDVWKSRDERLMMVLKLSKGRLFVVIVLANRGQAKDNGKPMDDLVDDTRKKVEAPLRKTSIWSGRKTNSPKRNVVFSIEMKFHYFDMDDMKFNDMEHLF